jgi:hypothetical protein
MKNNTHIGDKNILSIDFLNNKQQETVDPWGLATV